MTSLSVAAGVIRPITPSTGGAVIRKIWGNRNKPIGSPPEIRCSTFLRAIAWFVAALVLWPMQAGPASPNAPPATTSRMAEQFVNTVGGKALELLARDGNQLAARDRDNLKLLIRESFDFERGTRFVFGRVWDEATPQQMSELASLLPDYALEVAVRTFSALRTRDIKDFKVVAANPSGVADILVLTHIQLGDAPMVSVGWRVHEHDGNLKFVDMTVDGMSMVVTLRDMINAEVRQKGIDGLITDIQAKLREFDTACN